jgi:hypothetical protein
MSLSSNDTVSRSAKIAHRLFEDRMLVITAKDSMLHRFNEVGTFVWQLLEKPQTVGAICAGVASHFDGFIKAKHSSDLHCFLEALEKKRCVEILRQEGG